MQKRAHQANFKTNASLFKNKVETRICLAPHLSKTALCNPGNK